MSKRIEIYSMSLKAAFQLLFLLFVLLCMSSCGGSAYRNIPRGSSEARTSGAADEVQVQRIIPTAPWQLWSSRDFGDSNLQQAEEAIAEGLIETAIDKYRQTMATTTVPQIKEAARLRLIGTLLKQGQSQAALEEISIKTSEQSLAPEELDPRFALLAAYAYLHQRNNDQSLAWFAVASRSADRASTEGIIARDSVSQILSGLSTAQFDSLSARWSADNFAGPLFRKERLRRAQGGAIMYPNYAQMFSPRYYAGIEPSSAGDPDALAMSRQEVPELAKDYITIGILLPLSGRFAEHAEKVKQGIELAVQESPYSQRIRLKIADTGGSPITAVSEYERLVREGRVDTVLGPLLVKTTEAVSTRSEALGVPILTFTKRSGIPQLGPTVFRLGATSESQVRELVAYSHDVLGLRRFAVVYPETPAGQEFASIFRDKIDQIGGEIVDSVSYFDRTPESLSGMVNGLIIRQPEAIFVPDTLERAFPVLESIRASELRDVIFLGPAQWSDPVAVRGYGQLIEGAVFVSLFNPLSQASPVVRFVEKYRERFAQEPELLAAQSFDATNLVLNSMFTNDSEDINKAFVLSRAENGVTGLLEVELDGEISRRMTVLRLSRGNLIEVMSGGSTSQTVPSDLLPSQPSSSLDTDARAGYR